MSAHTIARLRPEMPAPVLTPQCSVQISRNPAVPSVYWAHRKRLDEPKGYNSDFCLHSSAFLIDGKHYCRRHAGMAALGILLAGGSAETLPAAELGAVL